MPCWTRNESFTRQFPGNEHAVKRKAFYETVVKNTYCSTDSGLSLMPDTTRLQIPTEPLCPAYLEDDNAGNTNDFYTYTNTYLHNTVL